ncbi:Zn-dependent exopeptidase [Hanseniaspora valbyensis NRRL Y-1626]|uniref:Inactive metallocarboxypeptidase ECM14 n=1 Tax=Hanseniaspora valbyensis NRRL Y-1626 TaxID=766949 RepID=A0A1B7TBT2_9ASCO|nr:Zn-dependent exopeptidase [Hanseniaspora valbyensis NRRL Y-1626]
MLLLTIVKSKPIHTDREQTNLNINDNKRKDYSHYNLIRCGTTYINNIDLDDLWMKNDDYMEFMVHENDIDSYKDCKMLGNIQDMINEEFELMFFDNEDEEDLDISIDTLANPFFKRYRNLEEIYQYMDELAYKYANLVRLENIGTTYEGRDLKAMHISAHDPISHDPNGPEILKKTIVITSGLHSREWATITTTLWIATKLASKYSTYKKETNYLNNLDFFIIPVFNPDGYEYTWNDDRLWRKTRQQTFHPRCFGIDLDRSFDFHWQNNENPCSPSYSGSSPFESLESKLLNDYLFEKKHYSPDFKLHGFLDFHSYGQEILYPYGFSCDLQPRDLENLLELSYGMARSIRLKTKENYQVMPSCKDKGSDLIPGFGSGNALDYMYHSKAYWAFQFKIRDLGEKGFLLPKKYIKPVGKENYAAVKHFCDFILNPEL